MRKLLILLFGTLIGLPAISQTQLAEVIKVWKTKKVNVVDGFTFRYRLWDKYDTAIYFLNSCHSVYTHPGLIIIASCQ